jgi:chlorite dismutase
MSGQHPDTAEGWYMLHDFRTVDWDAWRSASERVRQRAVAEGVSYLRDHEAVADAPDGSSAVFSVLGHDADLLVIHFRPEMADLDTAERRFEQTAFSEFTERASSYVSVTEVGGYTSEEMAKDPADIEDAGLAKYVRTKLYPEMPDTEFVCFYPMDKRRQPGQNWYDLPFDERAELMARHGEIGKGYAGKVTQVITGSIGFDDYEWGVTLWSNDPTHIKDLLYEMRFDEGSSKYAEFGPFQFGRRFPPGDLGAFVAGEPVPAEGDDGAAARTRDADGPTEAESDDVADGESEAADVVDLRAELADAGVYAGQPHGEDVYALVVYSEADLDELKAEVEGLAGNFDHYDTHVKTAVYRDVSGEKTAVSSLWETEKAASVAAGYLSDLPGVVREAGEGDTFSTLGMFYTVEPDHREDFVERFETVGELLADMDGHVESSLLANVEDEDDMFVASEWAGRDAALEFFRSPEFRETVDWGREILADRPRHVFLA